MVTQSWPPDAELVQRLCDRDEAAFALLLDAWSAGMLRLARSFVTTNASAEEVLQDTWMAVISGVGSFEGRSSLKTWVYRILVNTAKRRGERESRIVPWSSWAPDTAEQDRSPRATSACCCTVPAPAFGARWRSTSLR